MINMILMIMIFEKYLKNILKIEKYKDNNPENGISL